MGILFYRQSVRLDGLYHSDMYAYILYIQGVDLGLRFPYPVLFLTGKIVYKIFFRHHFLGAELGIAISTFIFELLGLIVTRVVLNRLLADKLKRGLPEKYTCMSGCILTFLAVAVNYVSMLFGVGGIWRGWSYRFTGVESPNPWHNATYIAAKPFAIAS